MTKQTKLGLGATAFGIVLSLAALVAFAGAALAAAGTASVDTATADADGNATATVSMGTGVGNWAFDVVYDPAKYTGVPTCTTTLGACTVNPEGPGVVRFAGFDATGNGVGGEVGKIVLKTTQTAGACSDLTLKLATKTGSTFQDKDAVDFAPQTFTSGKVCAAAAAATATAAASATATAKALPSTGGPAGGNSFELGWLVAIAGLVVVAAGAWTLARAREDS